MVKFLLWTIYSYDFESYLFERELFYEKACFHSGLTNMARCRVTCPRLKDVNDHLKISEYLQ